MQVDGFTLGVQTQFTSVDDQAAQVIDHPEEVAKRIERITAK